MSATLTQAQITAIATTVARAVVVALSADVSDATPVAPAKKAPAKKAPAKKADSEFVTWLRETAPERHARKATNRETLAPMLDAKRAGWRGAANREAIWTAAKAGKRIPAVKK
jgi:hypothetical protein